MDDWCMQLGLSHCQRDAEAADDSRTRQDRDRAQITEAQRRWPGIVSAIRTLTRRYNEGAGREVLTVIDNTDGYSDALVVTIVASGAQTLRVAVNGAELCVRPTPTAIGAADDGQRWITFGAMDGAIAAYALQDWLAHL